MGAEVRDVQDASTATSDMPLVEELEDYRTQVEAIRKEARELLEGLNDRQFNWRQAEGRWSIGECLAHLNLTGQVYLRTVDKGIKQARSEQLFSRGPYRHGLLGRWFLRATEPPVRRVKVKAPKVIAPLPEHLLAVVAPAFMSLQDAVLQRIREANGLDLGRARIKSPFLGLLRLSLGQSILAILAHERRHLWQARQVRNDPSFPKA
ncbi:MAG TPA: DinB family protein [Pyrinomonadaceae bacterium]|jgi:hypothetical protein